MANQEHLDILKQGVEAWNQWREKHTEVHPDLREADLSKANLAEANLCGADLWGANLIEANLTGVDLREANLCYAWLWQADLTGANLIGTKLGKATLVGANFSGTDLGRADLSRADLLQANFSGANLSEADLLQAILAGTNLSEVNLDRARVGFTYFADVNLSHVQGLETIRHFARSHVSIDTIIRSSGNIPEIFLRGTGVPDTIIDYIRSLVNHPIDFYSCFISYSCKDEAFAKRLYTDLQNNNVRCWFAPEDMKIGDRMRDRVDQSIRLHDKLLLILSEQSLMSEWVEDEVEAALERERLAREQGGERLVLFPVRLDEAVKTTTKAWAAKLRRQRHIGDFTQWKNHDDYQKALTRLLRDLKASAQQ